MRLVLAFAAAAMLAGAASAQTTTAAKTTAAKTTSSSVSNLRKPRTPQSIDCSKQADAKGLHGNDRKKFRSSCIKAAK